MTRRECQLASARRRDDEYEEPGWSGIVGVWSSVGVLVTVAGLLIGGWVL